MVIMCIVGAIIGLIILGAIVGAIENFYSAKYGYKIYKFEVLLTLFFVAVLSVVFWMGLDGSISKDNMIAAAVVGFLLWISVFIYNIIKTSVIAGILLTLFQSIMAIFIVFLLILLMVSNEDKHKKRRSY